ncbi:NADP-dependent alkenal double bond reductase p2 [Phtheirospermum japonicum]|uniref:NADP-dependent alkenal double bond reductase p2 n=1 Tax=Phtheirospermum japonicum TaxID=374723 RepID=A0A830DDI7_9LAMI|nr:NADP-dependent alkenal double bond reductase p2 [Phtheirospermum japonicum]
MAEVIIRNKYVVTKSHIDGAPEESDFSISEQLLSLKPTNNNNKNVVVVKNLYVSIDPYQINRMKAHSSSHKAISFSAAILPGQVIEAFGVGRVMESGHPDLETGDLVSGLLCWGEYTVVEDGQSLQKLDASLGFPLSYYAGGVLGSSGITAYGGFFQVCKPKKGDNVFVSAASGSVGLLVGQYAKLFGCYVVGCAGTKEKVDFIKEKIGFDDAFNYKEETNLKSTLQRYFPKGIDIYFDNVGGEMLEAVVENMNAFGRIAVCGVISEYTNSYLSKGKLDMIGVIYKRIRIEGFLSIDFDDTLQQQFFSATTQHLHSGELKAIEDISYGVESIPMAFIGLFRGNNVGKKLVRIAED